ncbi:MAG: ATP-binding protein [Geobacteraceae bacterium]|nr:ATP-binding protein [Geobacteraceae bacterium]
MSPHARGLGIRTSFQFKLFSIFSLLTLLTTSLLSALYIINENHQSRQHAAVQLQLQAKHLADASRLPLYAENHGLLLQLAEQAAQSPGIRAVVISAGNGRVLADIRSKGPADASGTISQTVEVHSNQLIDSIEASMTGGHDAAKTLIGTVRMVRGTADLSHALRRMVIYSAGMAIVFWLSVSLLSYLVLRRVTRSFNALMQGIDVLQEGDFTARIVIESDDEPDRAAHAINNLAQTLQIRTEENSRLQEERLHLERQMLLAQKLESLGIMAGGIAHDFNNLLQAILGNMELASSKLDPEAACQKYLRHATNAAKRASLLTDMMLTYVGQGSSVKKELNLNTLLRENADMMKTVASSVTTELQLSAELPLIVADEAHIQQLVMNLMTNAAEAIVEQPGLIRLTTGTQVCDRTCLAASLLKEKAEPGRFVFFEISDNGCGMSAETLHRLFDPFFTTKFTGRGLGMSAVLGIMKTHHGALFVESEPGRGTTFRALFPVPESAAPALDHLQAPSGRTRMPQSEPGKGETAATAPDTGSAAAGQLSGVALVVDDEKSVLRICTKMVRLCGFTVITACDGIDAVNKFREHCDEIAVILMDLTMPNMDGIAAMGEIYRIKPDSKVILSSGFHADELSERITSQPPCGFIRKPYCISELESELRRVVHEE